MTKKIEPLSGSTEPTKGLEIYNTINANKELEALEIQGFIQGEKQGKTLAVTLHALFTSLEKQYVDWRIAYINKDIAEMKKAVADIRNVSGCIFIKLLEGGDRKER